MSQKITSVKGTRDFYPEQMRIRTWIYNTMRTVSERFGAEEYEGPFLEYIDLYAAKSGEELVKEQAFTFQDRGGDWITLRPELTPSLARMVAQKQNQLAYPLRWWSFGPMWRYERPQKGRSREFFQWNIDFIGADSPEVDAELAAVGAEFFREVGITPQEVQILVNNRKLVDSELQRMNIPSSQHGAVFRFIDKRDKMSVDKWQEYGLEIGMDDKQVASVTKMVANQSLWERSPELQRFFKAVQALGLQDYVRYAPEVIRGLDYYTGTVFEARDRDGEFRAILGGGRYDNLVADVGGEPLPAVGFAMGDVVIALVLQKYGKLPDAEKISNAPVLVTLFDETSIQASLELAAELRRAKIPVTCYLQPISLGKQFKYASRINSPAAVVIGPDEVASGTVAIKNLSTFDQQSIPRSAIVETVKSILAAGKAL